jgi:DNA-directed RNA polymerase subunit H (RpoH/RPB5)
MEAIERFEERIRRLGRTEDVEIVTDNAIKNADKFISTMKESGTVYIFSSENMYISVRRRIKEPLMCNIFHREELLICPMDNDMVPEHTLLEDWNDLPQRERMYKSYEFPRILFSDPVVRWNGWKCNSMIRIVRKSGGVFYRFLHCTEDCNC